VGGVGARVVEVLQVVIATVPVVSGVIVEVIPVGTAVGAVVPRQRPSSECLKNLDSLTLPR